MWSPTFPWRGAVGDIGLIHSQSPTSLTNLFNHSRTPSITLPLTFHLCLFPSLYSFSLPLMSLLFHRGMEEWSGLIHSLVGKDVMINLHQMLKPHPLHFLYFLACICKCVHECMQGHLQGPKVLNQDLFRTSTCIQKVLVSFGQVYRSLRFLFINILQHCFHLNCKCVVPMKTTHCLYLLSPINDDFANLHWWSSITAEDAPKMGIVSWTPSQNIATLLHVARHDFPGIPEHLARSCSCCQIWGLDWNRHCDRGQAPWSSADGILA